MYTCKLFRNTQAREKEIYKIKNEWYYNIKLLFVPFFFFFFVSPLFHSFFFLPSLVSFWVYYTILPIYIPEEPKSLMYSIPFHIPYLSVLSCPVLSLARKPKENHTKQKMQGPVGPRASKEDFMHALGLNPHDPQHEQYYRAMRVYISLLSLSPFISPSLITTTPITPIPIH